MHASPIPSLDQCLVLMHDWKMPQNIQRHSILVARVSTLLGELLLQSHPQLDLRLVLAASLLHDIGKAPSLSTGEDHGRLGAGILEKRGYRTVALIVGEHATMDLKRSQGPITESLLVNYADKRVRHDEIVTLEERFEDLAARYGKSRQHRLTIWDKLSLYQGIEANIFRNLPLSPESLEAVTLEAGSAWPSAERSPEAAAGEKGSASRVPGC